MPIFVSYGAAICVSGLHRSVAEIAGRIAELSKSGSWWRRAVDWFSGAARRRHIQIATLEQAQKRAELDVQQAKMAQLESEREVAVAEAQHRNAARAHADKCAQEAIQAEQRIAAIKAADELWRAVPGAANLGFDAVYSWGLRIADWQRQQDLRYASGRSRMIPALKPP